MHFQKFEVVLSGSNADEASICIKQIIQCSHSVSLCATDTRVVLATARRQILFKHTLLAARTHTEQLKNLEFAYLC